MRLFPEYDYFQSELLVQEIIISITILKSFKKPLKWYVEGKNVNDW